ncbi:MAG: class I SAM-dependent methyltransferase [Candidatus Aminicenantes bacterium]|nr:MAG: class I SAM-dependent methyltransferase [Candidatus Aminicenantes bacterium]
MTNNIGDTLYSVDARFYDLDNRPGLKADIPFYLEDAAKIKGPILELACGTVRLTIPLAQAGHEVWALEYSETMIEEFKKKMKNLPTETTGKIHLVHGDMSNFQINQKFPLILLPARSFQLLLEETKENACLKNVRYHLTDNGYFIIDIANFIGKKEKANQWVSEEEVLDWENIDPVTGDNVRRTHKKKQIDTQKQIIYPLKTYYITKKDGSTAKIVKQSAWKYFFNNQIKSLLTDRGFKIIEELGTYDRKPITEDSHFIFICQKKH